MDNKSLSVTGVEKASEEKKMAASAGGKQIAVSSKIGATNEQSVYSGGKTLIRKLPDKLLVCIFIDCY
jgi:hypothetical protein